MFTVKAVQKTNSWLLTSLYLVINAVYLQFSISITQDIFPI